MKGYSLATSEIRGPQSPYIWFNPYAGCYKHCSQAYAVAIIMPMELLHIDNNHVVTYTVLAPALHIYNGTNPFLVMSCIPQTWTISSYQIHVIWTYCIVLVQMWKLP